MYCAPKNGIAPTVQEDEVRSPLHLPITICTYSSHQNGHNTFLIPQPTSVENCVLMMMIATVIIFYYYYWPYQGRLSQPNQYSKHLRVGYLTHTEVGEVAGDVASMVQRLGRLSLLLLLLLQNEICICPYW